MSMAEFKEKYLIDRSCGNIVLFKFASRARRVGRWLLAERASVEHRRRERRLVIALRVTGSSRKSSLESSLSCRAPAVTVQSSSGPGLRRGFGSQLIVSHVSKSFFLSCTARIRIYAGCAFANRTRVHVTYREQPNPIYIYCGLMW